MAERFELADEALGDPLGVALSEVVAADGLTNGGIARALFVTTRTVENHLGHAYRKLDIESRAELPRTLGASQS